MGKGWLEVEVQDDAFFFTRFPPQRVGLLQVAIQPKSLSLSRATFGTGASTDHRRRRAAASSDPPPPPIGGRGPAVARNRAIFELSLSLKDSCRWL